MANSTYNQYLEAEVLGADPVKLVIILYRAAVESVASARRHLRNGEIMERSQKITKAWEILNELLGSLDHARGLEISRSLAGLYTYMQTLLMEANTQQKEAPLAEVEQLLTTLAEAWRAAAPLLPVAVSPAAYTPVSCSYQS